MQRITLGENSDSGQVVPQELESFYPPLPPNNAMTPASSNRTEVQPPNHQVTAPPQLITMGVLLIMSLQHLLHVAIVSAPSPEDRWLSSTIQLNTNVPFTVT